MLYGTEIVLSYNVVSTVQYAVQTNWVTSAPVTRHVYTASGDYRKNAGACHRPAQRSVASVSSCENNHRSDSIAISQQLSFTDIELRTAQSFHRSSMYSAVLFVRSRTRQQERQSNLGVCSNLVYFLTRPHCCCCCFDRSSGETRLKVARNLLQSRFTSAVAVSYVAWIYATGCRHAYTQMRKSIFCCSVSKRDIKW